MVVSASIGPPNGLMILDVIIFASNTRWCSFKVVGPIPLQNMSPIYEAMGKRAPWEYFSLPNGITEFLSKETMMINKNLLQFRPTTLKCGIFQRKIR